MAPCLPIEPADATFFCDEAMAARAARRLQMLSELAGIGMEIARALQRRMPGAMGSGPEAASAGDSALGLPFARVARAVRQTLALEDRLDRPRPAAILSL